ncbi:MAG: lysophospholipid acyltransferase family protein [Bacillota bacterium]|nr:lysophospholipid acyltransferase family protein [Bacillota bacterium]
MSILFYKFGRNIFYLYLKIFYCLRIHGRENLPTRKPYIVCSNHIKWLDPMTVGAAIPSRIRVNFMAKKEVFSNPIFAYLLRKVGAFPVNRQEADYSAIKTAYRLLQEGEVLGLFPEGSRSKDGQLQKAYNGAALIAVRSGVPVLPVAIPGPYRLFKPLHIHIGKPFVLPPLVYENKEEKKARLEEMSNTIMQYIENLKS